MAIFRCNKCAHLREIPSEHVGKTVKCPRCQQAVTIYDTVLFIEKLLEKYLLQTKMLRELQQQIQPQIPENASPPEKTSLEEVERF